MKRLVTILIILTVAAVLLAENSDLETTLDNLSGQAAKSYVSPIVSAFGSNMNGGWFHNAPKAKFLGLDFEFGMVFMGSLFPDDNTNFAATGSFQFTAAQADKLTQNWASTPELRDALIDEIVSREFDVGIYGPTIIGSGDDNVMVDFSEQEIEVTYMDNGNSITETIQFDAVDPISTGIGGLLDGVSILPLGAPQLSIGTVWGTRATFRYLPAMEIDKELGELSYFGFGVEHNIKSWLMVPLPVDVGFAFNTQTMKLGDIVEASAISGGFNISKQFGPGMLSITPYGGFMLESSNMEFKYDYVLQAADNPTEEELVQQIKFDLDGDNTYRFIVGFNAKVGAFSFNADYNIADYNSFTTGIGISF